MIVKITIALAITLAGMWGGQKDKWVRRYLASALAFAYHIAKKKKERWKAVFYFLLMAIFCLGYGETSWLRRILKSDALVRIVYGLLIGAIFLPFGKWYALIVMPIAYSVRAKGFKIGKFDWLWEDFIRFASLGILVVI